ncbi:sulfotransferase domain-containing protein [Mangrovimonas sp. DI 80]|uniref:sulfotransferase domain-containing protein n=1 Tax=Mangrovimonas sp. DI 80 TaxID=1779330 RepID=UPI0009765792|nr:sulfotransferase domain-containing protein [Mangrovimonas sp. DI 80]OMP31775.1 hypothetical protein BKM32_01560 [Mangrovimonas sp. DI 80]
MSTPLFPKDRQPIVVTSHPRSGTHLCIDFLRRHYKECTIPNTFDRGLDDLYFSIEGLLDTKTDIQKVEKKGVRVLNSCSSPLVKYHGYSERVLREKYPFWMDYLSKGKMIYIYRNIYEVLCSKYIYMQTFENDGKGVGLSTFIRQPFAGATTRVDFWVREVNRFLLDRNVLTLSYESIISKPAEVLNLLDEFLEMESSRNEPLLPPKTNHRLKLHWQRFFYRYPDNTAILASHKGVHKLNPNSAFSKEDLIFINGIASETLKLLNYPIIEP